MTYGELYESLPEKEKDLLYLQIADRFIKENNKNDKRSLKDEILQKLKKRRKN